MTVLEYLRSQSVAVVSTVSAAGFPQAATVFFATHVKDDGRFDLYFATREHTRKNSNMVANPEIAMVIGMDPVNPRTVQLQGKAEMVKKNPDETSLDFLRRVGGVTADLSQAYTESFFYTNPFGMIKGVDFVFFRVTPSWVRYMHPDETGKELVYTQVVE